MSNESSASKAGSRPAEQSIRISAGTLISILLAIILGHWALFKLYFDSQQASILNEIKHSSEYTLAEVRNVAESVRTNRDNVQINRVTLTNIIDRMNDMDKEYIRQIAELSKSMETLQTKYDLLINKNYTDIK